MNKLKLGAENYKYGFSDPEYYAFKSAKGLSEQIVAKISQIKDEPKWMKECRLRALDIFYSKPLPGWGPDLSSLDFDNIHYYVQPSKKQQTSWNEVPEYIKKTFEKLGIPEAERKFLAGVGAQYESEMIYHNLQKDLQQKGVVFVNMENGVKDHPEMVKQYFGSVVGSEDNKFAALNGACWSGGSFVYIPKGLSVEIPLQAYFRINTENLGQFERTLIIADEGSFVHYIEGCSAQNCPRRQ